jgi:hypothetical protein
MPTVTLAQICDGLVTTLGEATGITTALSYDELHEGPAQADLPMLQVYPETGDCDALQQTSATTFQGGVAVKGFEFIVDLLARQRSQLPEDMQAVVDAVDNVMTVLEAQRVGDKFGVEGIRQFHWRWQRVVYQYAQAVYVGARFTVTVWVF